MQTYKQERYNTIGTTDDCIPALLAVLMPTVGQVAVPMRTMRKKRQGEGGESCLSTNCDDEAEEEEAGEAAADSLDADLLAGMTYCLIM